MSRIGKLAIKLPPKVEVEFTNQIISISGPYGKLNKKISELVTLTINNNEIYVLPTNNSRQAKALHGLSRTLINNMVIGVSNKFERRLEIKGVGYRSQVQEKNLILNLGYSHPVKIQIPDEISVEVIKNTILNFKSCDKELLGLFASKVRSWRSPEPYKGKGILYKGESIIRKAGKSAK